MPGGRLPTDPKTGRLQKHLMELKIRDVYQDLPSDARILIFHRANNAKANRINRFMNNAVNEAPELDYEKLERRRREKAEYSAAIADAIRKKNLMKVEAKAASTKFSKARTGGRCSTANRQQRSNKVDAMRPSTSAPTLIMPLSPIATKSVSKLLRSPTSPSRFKYVPIKYSGVLAGESCNEAQLRLTKSTAVTGVHKFRLQPNQLNRQGQGDIAPRRTARKMLAETNGSNLNIAGRSSDFRNEINWRVGLRAHPEVPPPSKSGQNSLIRVGGALLPAHG